MPDAHLIALYKTCEVQLNVDTISNEWCETLVENLCISVEIITMKVIKMHSS